MDETQTPGDPLAQAAGPADTHPHARHLAGAGLAEVFEQSPSFMAVLRGPEHVFELANDRYRQLVGHRDLIGKPVREAFPEVAGQGFLELLDGVYASGEAFFGRDTRIVFEGGPDAPPDERYLDFVYQPIRDSAGAVSGIFVQGIDLTERKRAEDGLRSSEARFRAAFDQAAVGMVLADMQGRIQRANAAFCAIVGYSADELIGETSALYTHPDDRARNVDHIRRLEMAQVGSALYEKRYVRKDGRTAWAQVSLSPVRAGGDASPPSGLIAVVEDVTERLRAADELRGRESQFRQLADAMPQIVFMARPDGHVDYFNRRWYEYTGLPEGETGFESWRHVHTEDGLRRALEAWPEAVRTGRPYEIEYPLRRHDGQFRWHLGRALPIRDEQGRVVRWFGTNTDIHDQRQVLSRNEQLLEAERAARAHAEHVSRMKDEFLATLSHELRTPLNAILGWSQILRTAPGGEDDVREGLAIIERNARAQTQIIEDLLDMGRIISGKVRLDVRPIELAAVVSAAIETVRPAADAKGVHVHAALVAADQTVNGDPGRLQQVFWNLLSNAVKFTPAGGHVRVRLARAGDDVEVAVADTGEGIGPGFLPHVFDRFRQADASTTRRHGGLGLGLAIVKQLAELHGGRVAVESGGAGRGATFTVRIPAASPAHGRPRPGMAGDGGAAADPAAPARPFPDASAPRLDGLRVVAVDDEPDARALLRRLLDESRAAVRVAATADEAVALIEAEPPDVLVSDIGMPGEDGYSLIRRVRALPADRGGRIPAIALTAYARAEDRTRALAAGFQAHLPKPVEPAELIVTIAALAGKWR